MREFVGMRVVVLSALLATALTAGFGCSCPCGEDGKGGVEGQLGQPCQLEPFHFDHDSRTLREADYPVVEANAACILAVGRSVVLTGHTDTRGMSEYNMAQGELMARAVKSALVKAGVPAEMIQTRSMGEERPPCRQATEECRRMCRRVEAAFE